MAIQSTEEALEQIRADIRDLRDILSKVIGTTYESPENRFSVEALDKAAKDFQKWSIERQDWVPEDKIGIYIKSVPYHAGRILREEFHFANWMKKGHYYLFSKKDLIAISKELADRNIDLSRYSEFLSDQAAFKRKLAKEAANKTEPVSKTDLRRKSKTKAYEIPKGLKNITTSDVPAPPPEKPREDLERLKREFKEAKLTAYIDVYKGTHAMLKNMYHYEKYLEPGLRRRCAKWCDEFNYANEALQKITGRKEKFKVEEQGGIEL